MNPRALTACSLVLLSSIGTLTPAFAAPDAKPVLQVAPDYSAALRRSGVEGEVVIKFTVSPKGEVQDPIVVSATDGALVAPSLKALQHWKFAPATENGAPVSVKAQQTFAFVIPDLHPDGATRVVASKPHSAT